MKERIDFVTNSSSSSFILFGKHEGHVIEDAILGAKLNFGDYSEKIAEHVAEHFSGWRDEEDSAREFNKKAFFNQLINKDCGYDGYQYDYHTPWYDWDRELSNGPRPWHGAEYFEKERKPDLQKRMAEAPKNWTKLENKYQEDLSSLRSLKTFEQLYKKASKLNDTWKEKFPEDYNSQFYYILQDIDEHGGYKRLDSDLCAVSINMNLHNEFERDILKDVADFYEQHPEAELYAKMTCSD